MSFVPYAGADPMQLPAWFQLERAPSVKPPLPEGVVGVCSWWPGDVLTFGDAEPHWEVISPWSDWASLDWEDHRVLDADADLDAIEALASRLYAAPVELSPGTYKLQPDGNWWPEDVWLDLPLFLIKRA